MSPNDAEKRLRDLERRCDELKRENTRILQALQYAQQQLGLLAAARPVTPNDLEARLRLIDLELAARAREQQAARHGAQALQEAIQRLQLLSDDSAVACVATLALTVRDSCTNNLAASVAVVASKTGETSVAGTSSGSGLVTLVVGAAGTWTITCTISGRVSTSTLTATCGATTTATVTARVSAATNLTVHVRRCDLSSFASVPVTVTKGAFTASGTTNGSGDVVFDVGVAGAGAGTYTITATPTDARYAAGTGSIVMACGTSQTRNVDAPAAATYRCFSGCADPIPRTLTLTDPLGNIGTAVFSATFNQWLTCLTYPANATVYNSCPVGSGGFQPTISIAMQSTGITLRRPVCTAAPTTRVIGTCNADGTVATAVSGASIASSSPGGTVTITSCVPFVATATFSTVETGSGVWTWTE